MPEGSMGYEAMMDIDMNDRELKDVLAYEIITKQNGRKDKMITIPIYGRWLFLAPDKRQYQQGSSKLVLSPRYEPTTSMEEMTALYVAIDLPLTPEHVYNWSDYPQHRPEATINSELGFDVDKKAQEKAQKEYEEACKRFEPILTIAGHRYVRNVLQNENEQTTNNEDETINQEDWNF